MFWGVVLEIVYGFVVGFARFWWKIVGHLGQ